MDPNSEEPLFSNDAVKDEVKEEVSDDPMVKEEVEDGEEWGNGGYITKEEPEIDQNPASKKRKWIPRAKSHVTQKESQVEVKEPERRRSGRVPKPNKYYMQFQREFSDEEGGKSVWREESNESSRKTRRIASGGGTTEDHEEATEEPFPAVDGQAVPPTSDHTDDGLPIAKLVSFNAHVLFSNEVIVKKEVEEEEGQNDSEERRNCPVDACLENLLSTADLVAHMKTHRSPLICGVCEKPFQQPSVLRQHYLVHTGERPYPCPICPQRFTRSTHLTTHMRCHSEEHNEVVVKEEEARIQNCTDLKRNCPADGCLENFLLYADLMDHMKRHPSPVICGVCQRPFSRPSALRQHYTAHTKEKRFVCRLCDQRFSSSSELTKHVGIHKRADIPLIQCYICGFKAAHMADLDFHMKTFPH